MTIGWGSAAGGIAFAIFLAFLVSVWIGLLVLWIMAIVDIVKRPEWQFRLAGQEKLVWLLLTIFINIVAVIYWLAIRKKLIAVEQAAAAGAFGPFQPGWGGGPPTAPTFWPPPGWHPDPSGLHHLRFWDGVRWTEHVSDPTGPGEPEQPGPRST